MSVNKVILVGRLGVDPKVTVLQDGKKVANFSLATNKTWVDKNGVRQEHVTWHRIVAWSALAETCGRYLAKGKQVYVEGAIDSRDYLDKDNIARTVTEIVAERVQFLTPGPTGQDVLPREEQVNIPF